MKKEELGVCRKEEGLLNKSQGHRFNCFFFSLLMMFKLLLGIKTLLLSKDEDEAS